MADKDRVICDLKSCAYKVPDSCIDCSKRREGLVPLECMEELMKDALELLKGQGWNILTEDDDGIIHGLPGEDGQYLMTDGKDIWIDVYVDGVADGIILDSGRDIREIIAWMYTPDLPKKDRR